MPMRPCLGTPARACGRLTTRADSRCATCATHMARARDQARGSRQARGYGAPHLARRAALLEDLRLRPGQPCPRCSEPMTVAQALDLGHSTPLRVNRDAIGDRLEHAHCNRGADD